MKTIKACAPAKLNLFLDISGKRENGYHEIDSVMQSVSLSDELNIQIDNGSGVEVLCSSCFAPNGRENIVWRAADRYLTENGINASVKIELIKNIPSPAGMGGGSSDAAAALRSLNEHFEAMSYDELVLLALKIGSDVPFCLKCGTQRVRGLGENLDRVTDLTPSMLFVIAASGEDVSTPTAYKKLDVQYGNFENYRSTRSPEPLIEALKRQDLRSVANGMYNIFEDAVLPFCPTAEMAKRLLLQNGAMGAMMSGSGSAVLGIFSEDDKDMAEFAKDKLVEKGIRAHLAVPFSADE